MNMKRNEHGDKNMEIWKTDCAQKLTKDKDTAMYITYLFYVVLSNGCIYKFHKFPFT
jgi:hypothetical protein